MASSVSQSEDMSKITPLNAILAVAAFSVGLFIASVNIATIITIKRTPSLRTLANTYVCSLACADFIVGLTCVFVALFVLPPVHSSLFLEHIHVCFFFHGIGIGPGVVSTFHMMLIAFDRYLYIMRPYFYQRVITFRVISGAIISVWIFGLFMTFICLFIGRPYDEVPVCDVIARQPIWYTFYLLGALYMLTFAFTVTTYAAILRAASRQRKAVRAFNVNPAMQSSAQQASIDKGTMKSIKFFLTVFGAFFCCITPNIVILGLAYYVPFPDIIFRLLNLLGFSNSAMNFVIYAAMNREFRKAYLSTLHSTRFERHLCMSSDAPEEKDRPKNNN